MVTRTLIVVLALALSSCATSGAPSGSTEEPAVRPEAPSASPSGWAVSIVGTPFALVFKGAVCAASLVVAAPMAGVVAIGDPYGEGFEILGDGIAHNCGPPYVISPRAAG